MVEKLSADAVAGVVWWVVPEFGVGRVRRRSAGRCGEVDLAAVDQWRDGFGRGVNPWLGDALGDQPVLGLARGPGGCGFDALAAQPARRSGRSRSSARHGRPAEGGVGCRLERRGPGGRRPHRAARVRQRPAQAVSEDGALAAPRAAARQGARRARRAAGPARTFSSPRPRAADRRGRERPGTLRRPSALPTLLRTTKPREMRGSLRDAPERIRTSDLRFRRPTTESSFLALQGETCPPGSPLSRQKIASHADLALSRDDRRATHRAPMTVISWTTKRFQNPSHRLLRFVHLSSESACRTRRQRLPLC